MKRAFSLLELIFAVVVIAIIASVGIPKLMNTKSEAVVSTVKSDIKMITTAIQTHYLIQGKLEKISHAITLNSSYWDIYDQKVIYKDNNNECIILEILNNKLQLTINEDVTPICLKLSQSGISTISYELY